MSLVILDTDTLSLFHKGHPTVCRNVAVNLSTGVATTVITVEEPIAGWLTFIRRAKRRDQIELGYTRLAEAVTSLAGWTIMSYTQAAMTRYDGLKAMRLNVGSHDLRIAAIALEHGATVVTRNRTDFSRIPGLKIVDWSI